MPKDIFRNKRDFARAEFATELYKPAGRPRPREVHEQHSHHHEINGKKVPMQQKLGRPW